MVSYPSDEYYLYVDAAYVRAELSLAGGPAEFHLGGAQHLPNNMTIGGPARTFIYDAIDESDPQAVQREAWLQRLERLPDTHVVAGSVRGRLGKRRQKGVDVALAVDALEAAYRKAGGTAVILTGDADFVPLVEAIRRAGPYAVVAAFERSLSGDLARAADRVMHLDPAAQQWRFSK